MNTMKVDAKVGQDRSLVLRNLPFAPGADLEVTLVDRADKALPVQQGPLWGSELTYVEPFEPVAAGDWEALK
jgi:hypothetical protein